MLYQFTLQVHTDRYKGLQQRSTETLTKYVRKTYIKPNNCKKMNMPKFIELIKTENKIEIRNVSMFIMKSFEIRKTLYFD